MQKKQESNRPLPSPDYNWHVVEDRFEVEKNRHYESILSIGTGYLSTRSCLDEGLENDPQALEYNWFPGNTTLLSPPSSKSKWGVYMPVIAAKHPFRRMGMANLPHYLGFVPHADGEKLDMELSEVTHYRRWLDLRTATLHRTLTWNTRSGCAIEVRFTRFMDPAMRFVCVQTCELKAVNGSPQVCMTSFVDNDVRTNGVDKFSERRVGHMDGGIVFSDVNTNAGNRIVTASLMRSDAPGTQTFACGGRRAAADIRFALGEGKKRCVTKISAVIADAYYDRDRLMEVADETLNSVAARPMDELRRSHEEQWRKRWETHDIEMVADDPKPYNSQLAIRQAIHQLLRAKGEDESRALVDPKGMIGELYYGAAFWDMEIFINPFFLYTNPVTGKNTPAFRYSHLDRARALAKISGYGGARYPWMQATDGDPVTTMWQYGDHEIHITADVVIGMWHYVKASGDLNFLFDFGAEIVLETARYWRDRVDVVKDRPGYHIYGVMGPDEYKPLTNNNAYTNYCARFNLRLAGEVVRLMAKQAPAKLDALRANVGLRDEELEAFDRIADGLVIPVDAKRNIVWQCDDFDTAFVDIDIDGIWKDKTVLFGKHISQEKLFRSKTMKQSDVVALMAVFPNAFTREQMEASFDYYKKYNIHDSSNSMCHHMMVAASLGRKEEAYESWLRSLDIDFAALPRAADGIHCANVGGMWQEVVFGFCGLLNAMCSQEMDFRPCLPEQIKRISFGIQWKSAPVRVTLTHEELRLENLSDVEIEFTVCGKAHLAAPGATAVARVSSVPQ
jgi:kojibiose phosphorylase